MQRNTPAPAPRNTPASDPDRGRLRNVAVGALKGVVGGILGTATMTVYRAPLFAGLPPTAEFWARFVGDGEPSEYPVQALILHFLYGAAAGGVFGLVSAGADRDLPGGRASASMALAAVYSALLSAFGRGSCSAGFWTSSCRTGRRWCFTSATSSTACRSAPGSPPGT